MSFEAPPPSSILPSWLREERAGVTLSEDEVQSLVELYGESLWTEANCVRTSVTYTSDSLQDVREMVVVIASEAVGKLVEKGKIADKEAHRVLANKKYVMWWMVPSRLWGGGCRGSGRPARSADHDAGAAADRAHAGRGARHRPREGAIQAGHRGLALARCDASRAACADQREYAGRSESRHVRVPGGHIQECSQQCSDH